MASLMRNLLIWTSVLATISHSLGTNDQYPLLNNAESQSKKVAIIGAGAAGTSTAYHLRKFAGDVDLPLSIAIYESNPYIGGRSTTVLAYDDPELDERIELGASIFVKVNKILYDAAAAFNLTSLKGGDVGSGAADTPMLGVWDGAKFVYIQQGGGWWDIAKMVWKYGLAPLKAQSAMKEVVGKFLTLYDAPRFPWADLSQAVEEIGLGGVVSSTGSEFLKAKGVSDAFAGDIVQASTRVNYAQNLAHIHGVEAMVCLAAEGAISIDGGNWLIFERMAAAAGADVYLNKTVESIRRLENGKFVIKGHGKAISYEDDNEEALETVAFAHDEYDAVVLAAPYQFANIDFEPQLQFVPDEVPYVKLHVTLFASSYRLAGSAFGLPAGQQPPQTILTTLSPDESPGKKFSSVGDAGFFSISTLHEVKSPKTGETEYLYKIFSPSPVNATFLHTIFDTTEEAGSPVTWIYRKVWHSYPYEFPRTQFEKVRLDEGVWYTSGIENFISTMETSALSGMNTARLILDGWIS